MFTEVSYNVRYIIFIVLLIIIMFYYIVNLCHSYILAYKFCYIDFL